MTDYKELAQLLFPNITKAPQDMEDMYPPRALKDGARVTRFAPSPTGFLHFGNLFTCMVSYKTAKTTDGVFYVRVEDTDQKRKVEGAIDVMLKGLSVYGINADEGVVGDEKEIGNYGPYYQSARVEIYQTYAKALVEQGLAYPCFCSADELDEIRAAQENESSKGYWGKWAKCRDLSFEQIKANIDAGMSWTLRLKSPGELDKKCYFDDMIKGKIEMPENVQDVVLLKSDGIPTYHFAHAVDDHFMRTNMVIRGDEWLASYPLHKQLFELCGFELPEYAHISPIMKMEISVDEDGNEHQHKRKLSKRKDPEAAVGFYQEQGYPSESVLEYLMTIANSNYEEWHAANPDKTIDDFTLSLAKMPASGALFDMVKLNDVSKEMISTFSEEKCYEKIMAWAKEFDEKLYEFGTNDKESFLKTISLWKMSGNKVRKDVGKWSDLAEMFGYLYVPEDELKLSYEVDEKYNADQMAEIINEYKKDLFLDAENWFAEMKVMGDKLGYCPNVKEYKKNPDAYKGSITDVCTIVRVAVTGKKNSPDLATIMNVIGKDRTIGRLDKFLAAIGK